jgi:hypothetical protein
MKRLFDETEGEPEGGAPPAAPAPATPAAPEPPKPPKAGEPPATPPAEPGIRARRPAPPKRPDLPISAPAPTPPAPAAATPPQNDEEFERGLVEGEKQMLDDARYAEKAFPAKYKGLGDKVRGFIKAHTKFLEDHPDIADDDPAYKKFLADNRPTMSRVESREIEEHRIAERARGPVDARVSQLEHQIFERDETPKIEKFANDTYQQLAREALPEEISKLIKEKGGLTEEIKAEFGDELETAHTIFTIVANDLKEFKRLTTKHPGSGKPLVEFDDKNPQHTRLTQMVADLCENFKATGGAQLQRNGKWFVTRDEWNQIDPARRGEFWTFTNAELEKRALAIVPTTVKETIRIKQEDLKRRGYVRNRPAPAAPATPPANPPPPPGSPALRPSPVPGGAGGGGGGGNPNIEASTKNLAAGLLAAE